ncbi:MAG: hypothetical protein LAQ30_28545 [Acidobacteriia bacterium]|nr:hypothetical protein [Terriglobia bacterium]
MGTVHALESDFVYLRDLFAAGLDGLASARHELDGRVFAAAKPAVWTTTVIGAAVGMLSTRAAGGRRSASNLAMGGLLGSIVGCGAGVAWTSRRFTWTAAHHAVGLVNRVRDARWLEKHPIDYA